MAGEDSTPYGVIYLIRNKINGKVYIGQTTVSVAERWSSHCKTDSYCLLLRKAIKKHGRDWLKRKQPVSVQCGPTQRGRQRFLQKEQRRKPQRKRKLVSNESKTVLTNPPSAGFFTPIRTYAEWVFLHTD